MLLKHNYHMHTARCGHAIGTDREYVEAAIRLGIETLGFSDHTPQNWPSVGIRMECDQLEEYVESVLRLKDEYRSEIRILLGLEVEYYREDFDEWQKMVEPYPFDYFLLGQHYIGRERTEHRRSDKPSSSRTDLTLYVDQVLEALRTGKFLYLAHPDLLHYQDLNDPFYESEMTRLCQAAKEMNIPLEINLLGIWDHRWYPNPNFWQIAGKVGNDVILGADAHQPYSLYREDAVRIALDWIHQNHLHRIEKLL